MSREPFSPAPLDTPITFNDSLPEETDVCIVGGGIIGVATALALSERGQKVVLIDKGRIAAEQSSRNWGWVRQTGRDAAELPIMMESIGIWRDLAAKTGRNALSFSEQGVVYLTSEQEALAEFEAFHELARMHALDSRLLSAKEVSAKFPLARKGWIGGLYTPSDGRVEPWYAVPALAQAIHQTGVVIREGCAALGIEVENNRCVGVITEAADIKASRVLLCGGAWTSLLLRTADIDLPQLSVRATVIRVDNIPDIGEGNSADDEIAFARRSDGGYTVALSSHHDFFIGPDAFRHLLTYRQAALSTRKDTRFYLHAPSNYPDAWGTRRRWQQNEQSPFQKMRVLNPTADDRLVDQMKRLLHKRFPTLEHINVTHQWAGMIDTMPDFVPVMDESQIAGLFIATGFSGHGFGIGPAAGRVMADRIIGSDAPDHDLTRFRLSRFTDGSKLVLGPH